METLDFDFPFSIPEIEGRALTKGRPAGLPPDFDIFEPYVLFKISPAIREAVVDAVSASGDNSLGDNTADIKDKLTALGRFCALATALQVGRAVDRSNVSGNTDINYADAYLCSYFMLACQFPHATLKIAPILKEWRSNYRRDLDYIILASDYEIAHNVNAGWKFYQGALKEPSNAKDRSFIKYLAFAYLSRNSGAKRPYLNLTSAGKHIKEKVNLIESEISSRELKYLSLWKDTAEECDARLKSKGGGLLT